MQRQQRRLRQRRLLVVDRAAAVAVDLAWAADERKRPVDVNCASGIEHAAVESGEATVEVAAAVDAGVEVPAVEASSSAVACPCSCSYPFAFANRFHPWAFAYHLQRSWQLCSCCLRN